MQNLPTDKSHGGQSGGQGNVHTADICDTHFKNQEASLEVKKQVIACVHCTLKWNHHLRTHVHGTADSATCGYINLYTGSLFRPYWVSSVQCITCAFTHTDSANKLSRSHAGSIHTSIWGEQ